MKKHKFYNKIKRISIKIREFFKKILKRDQKSDIIFIENDVTMSLCKHSDIVTVASNDEIIERLNNRRNIQIMCKASEIGKIVVNKCLDKELDINTQKLQKLLVLIQVESIEQSGFPMFAEDIRIWDCGVAIKEVDEDFRANGIKFTKHLQPNVVLLDSEIEYIDTIVEKYGHLSALELNNLWINSKVVGLGDKKEGDTVPHVSPERLMEAFAK